MKPLPVFVLSITAFGAVLSGCSNGSAVSSFSPAARTVAGAAHRTRPAQSYNLLYAFAGGADGADPQADLVNGLYGTTVSGGGSGCGGGGCGTFYRWSTASTSYGTYTRLYGFAGGTDGMAPVARLAPVNGLWYGTTSQGGGYGCGGQGCGTIYTVDPSGNEGIIHSFTGGLDDGAKPTSRLLVLMVSGEPVFFGTTAQGGGYGCGGQGCGTVYTWAPQSQHYTVLHSFTGGTDGAEPYGLLFDHSNAFYGTTVQGGGYGCGGSGCGTVYSITATGSERVIHSFAGGTSDGANPYGGVRIYKGKFYGTTQKGGAGGLGTIYSLTANRHMTEAVIHSFGGGSYDGANPMSVLLVLNNTFYGTTLNGGSSNDGTLFSYSPSLTNEAVLHPFAGALDGAHPYAGVIQEKGTLYGTTTQGGSYDCPSGCGTIYSFAP